MESTQPAARTPTAEVAPRPKPVATIERRVAQPGDRICVKCAEPNDPARKFCRRCGTSLAIAQVMAEPKLPWYRRIFRRTPKAKPQYAAGERLSTMKPSTPGRGGLRSGVRQLFKVRNLIVVGLGLVVAIGIFGYVGIPSWQRYVADATSGGIPGVIDSIKRFVNPPLLPVHPNPADITATSELPGHEARKAFDGFFNTDWQGSGATPSIHVKFAEPTNLSSVIVRIGNEDAFVDMRRPATLEFDFPDGSSTTLTLADTHDPQTFDLSASNIDSMTIKVTSTSGPAGTPVSISLFELFRKG
jgi:ribosomal protein L40E